MLGAQQESKTRPCHEGKLKARAMRECERNKRESRIAGHVAGAKSQARARSRGRGVKRSCPFIWSAMEWEK